MAFNIALEQPSNLPLLKEVTESPEDYVSLVIEACSLLGETDCRFLVSGFGDSSWPVDVCYDLATVLEQLPDLLATLRVGEGGVLDFFGQGVERRLEFFSSARQVEIRCRSGTAWKPDPATEQSELDHLEVMFVRLAFDFSIALEKVSPTLARTPPISAWQHREV